MLVEVFLPHLKERFYLFSHAVQSESDPEAAQIHIYLFIYFKRTQEEHKPQKRAQLDASAWDRMVSNELWKPDR